jgi:hypothetical protein
LPELPRDYIICDLEFFIKILSGELRRYVIHWDDYSVIDLIFIYRINGCLSIWKPTIERTLKKRGFDVSAL